jgi:hypothetical protein
MLIASWLDGWNRVRRAPAIIAGMWALTVVLALPLTLTLRAMLEDHVGRSLAANQAADAVNYDWWQEFTAQATGPGTTFTPAIIGFAATLDNIGSILDAQREIVPITAALAVYIAGWTFFAGGILDRYARRRPTRAAGFFAASGVYFFRFLRLAVIAGLLYWWMFAYVHAWLFDELYPDLTRAIAVERSAFLVRAGLYFLFGAPLLFGNLVLDYTKIRAVVEDRHSMVGALAAALRFIIRHPAAALGLYALNGAAFLILLAVWALVAPGAGGAGLSLWLGVAAGHAYLVARLLLKLQFLASQTALFQAGFAHAGYTAAPAPIWPEPPAAETIAR